MKEQGDKPDVAPGDLEMLRLFLNTRDLEAGIDEVGQGGDLASWLHAHELLEPGETADQSDVAKAGALREAIRALLRERAEPSAAAAFNAAARSGAPLQVEISPGAAVRLVPTRSGVPRALARIIAIVAEYAGTAHWARLKICGNPSCQWAFYDHARNKTGRWCNMATCGNKVKARRYRRRQVEAATIDASRQPSA